MCLLGGLIAPPPLLLLPLLLLLCPPAAQGDCSFPPEVPNAIQTEGDRQSFPERTTVTYKCKEGFVKVPGKADSVVCLNNKWSEVAEFCNRSCDVPTRLQFASLKKSFTKQNYFPVGSIVEYECRPGYQRDHLLSGKLTCLPNFIWSKPNEFCKRKSCPNPGDLRHGHVSIPTDILYAAVIHFSCNKGYRLVGAASSYCSIVDDDVGWSDPLPECQEIFCPEPPKISNGVILDPQNTYVYQQAVKYACMKGLTLIGENSIYCTVKGDQGEWSGPLPECKGSQISAVILGAETPTTVNASATKPTSAPQKPTTGNVPGTEATSTQKPTTADVSGTKVPSAPQKPTTINAPTTKSPSTLQKSNTVNVPATEVPSTQKPDTISSSATEALPTPQKPSTVHVSATKTPPTSQKPNTINSSATKTPSTPQKPNTINSSAAEALPIPQKPNTVHVSATKAPSTPQKPNTVHVSATKAPSTPQKPDTINSSAAEALPTPQNPNTVHVSATKTPSTPQKPTTAKDSATAKKSPISNALSTETPPAAQNPIVANASATQAMPATHRSSTAKASFTHSLPATRKSTAIHAPVTKGLHTTKRLTSARITAKQSSATPRTTSAPRGRGTLSSDAAIIAVGLAGTVIGTVILVKIFWHCGKSGTHRYNTDSLVYDASNHWLANLAEEELRRKCTPVCRIFLVS
ncbi:complement decay-accelerating factor isoform X5 [Lontra canadensis]|uniref:complement decay-accelerating factor isoform X4 n=1 Tax=Lontra canadensis TaxID=76717 RepID=UPI0013F32E0B|nr:complement decay-accelerating factor isoform X4 [Lontra canadensis]XP_032734033.1 complement decay-accelerating factor isoform X5 [Lontra canadensis]